MKAVVFGGSGFVGSHVADALTRSGYEVVVFDRTKSKYINSSQRMVIGDILNREKVLDTVKGASAVFNYAGIADLDGASTRPYDTIMLNVVGTCNILDACVKEGVDRFIYASSFYATSEKGGFYRCSKQSAELYIEEYHRKYNLDYTILRYGSLYGTRADKNNGIRKMLCGAFYNDEIVYSGNGDETREYIHVVDAAELSVKILDDKYKNAHIVLSGHDSYKVCEVIEVIKEIFHKNISVIYKGQEPELHYRVTPYTYKPQNNMKLVSEYYHDLGQGIIECIEEIAEENKSVN